MSFADWRQRSPQAAAREVLQRVAALRPGQQRAAFASLPSEAELTSRFAAAPQGRPLSGVPFFVKDLFDVAGEPTRAGSSFLAEVRPTPTANSALVEALLGQGAVLAGKTHLHEFAYGLTGENPHYGDCEHPLFPGRTSGGSSSGSVVAVAAGAAPLSVGTDTGGSVRVPAAYCGLYGFRMTPHHAWIADAFPLAPDFDTAGWFTATANDMATAIGALIGLQHPGKALRGCHLPMEGLDAPVSAALRPAAEKLAPAADAATAASLRSAFAGSAEAYAVLQSIEAFAVHREWIAAFRSRYSPEVWTRIDRGRRWTPSQIEQAAARRDAVRAQWKQFFATYDFLVMPATPFAAPTKAEGGQESRNRLLELSTPASLGGRPVLTLPVAMPSGLTTGLQIVVADAQSPVLGWALTQTGR